ncbi:MAG: CSLREA domain-containing protein, partial [Chloroflexota bacterium]|nr:CSLREA domain-containing protein [Chloroflexota bacterium]
MTSLMKGRLTRSAVLTVGLLFALAWFGPRTALAAGFTVNTTSDTVDVNPGNGTCADSSGNCSLRAAVMEANALSGADTITLPAGTFTLSRIGQNEDNSATGDLDVAGTVSITGSGSTNTVIDGNNTDAVFDTFIAPSGTTFNLSSLTIQHGNPTGSSFEGAGGLYIKNTVTMSMSGVSVLNNTANTSGGGIWNEGNLTISNSTVSGNQANGVGGGIRNAGTPAASLTVTNSTISNNTAEFGGGIYDSTDGGINLAITGSTLSGNQAVDRPGGTAGDFGDGGAIYATTDGGVTVSKSTLTGNTAARNGGAIYFRDDLTQAAVGTLSVTLNRVVSNTASGSGSSLYRASGNATAERNWWGCNAGPASAPCDRVSGTVDFTPWLVLSHTASPASISAGQSSTLTADFLSNSDASSNLASDLTSLIGLPITFNNPVLGTVSSAQSSIQSNGKATATFTAGSTTGTGHADATVDSATVTANITITGTPPSVTTDPVDQTVT